MGPVQMFLSYQGMQTCRTRLAYAVHLSGVLGSQSGAGFRLIEVWSISKCFGQESQVLFLAQTGPRNKLKFLKFASTNFLNSSPGSTSTCYAAALLQGCLS